MKILSFVLLSLFLVSGLFAQQAGDPAGTPTVQSPAPVEPVPIGTQLADAVSEFTKAVQAADRGADGVSDAEAEEARLQAALADAQAAKTAAAADLGVKQADIRSTGEAVIALLRKYLDGLP